MAVSYFTLRLTILIVSVFIMVITLTLSSPMPDTYATNYIPTSEKFMSPKASYSRRQERTLADMMGQMMNMSSWKDLFKLNGTQFSWVPLGSLLFNPKDVFMGKK